MTEKLIQNLREITEVDFVQVCVSVLVNLSVDSENQCKLVQMGLMSPLIGIANHENAHIRHDVASIFCYMSTQPKHRDGVFSENHFKAMHNQG